jgi:hypothetical protein
MFTAFSQEKMPCRVPVYKVYQMEMGDKKVAVTDVAHYIF